MAPSLHSLAKLLRVPQFLKFCLVGVTGVVVDMLILHVLVESCGWNVSLSKFLSAEVAMLNNFLWNEIWTFRGSPDGSGLRQRWLIRLLKFNAICSVGIGLAIILLNLFFRVLHLNLYVANLFAIALVTLWNFWMNALLNWRVPNSKKNTEGLCQEVP